MATTLTINGEQKSFDAPADMPLLWVLRDVLGMTGTKFGCGIAQCGACTVHIDGKPVRSCVLPVGAVARSRRHHHRRRRRIAGRRESAEGLARSRSDPVRLLPVRPDHVGRGAARGDAQSRRLRHRRGDGRQHLPLRHLCAHPRGHQAGRVRTPVVGAHHDSRQRRCPQTVSRRALLTGGLAGGFLLAFHLPVPRGQRAGAAA